MIVDLRYDIHRTRVRALFERFSKNRVLWTILTIISLAFAFDSAQTASGTGDRPAVDERSNTAIAVNSMPENDLDGQPTQDAGLPELKLGMITLSGTVLLWLRLALIGLVLLALTIVGVLLGNRLALQ